jgi:HD superfamily phosphodiesterase
MKREDIIRNAEVFARNAMKDYDGGHDWQHIERVRKLAGYINSVENIADPFILDVAVILHDCADSANLTAVRRPITGLRSLLTVWNCRQKKIIF